MTTAGTVTLLFTDLVGSTSLLERLGDDAAEQLRRTHFRLLREAVAVHGGHEVKNLGDGLMVVFTSAVEALGCAVAMQQAVHRHNERQGSERLEVRIGLHVGEPIHAEEDYFGTSVAIAKRLCDRAQGGQIVASELVRRLVGTRGRYDFRDLGGLVLKGVAEPLPACEVVWGPAPAPRFPLPAWLAAGERTAFVGRKVDLDRLRQAWDRVRAGQRQLVLLAGEPGIGKTRLAQEFTLVAHAEGATVLLGRSSEETLLPYQPFVEALAHYVAACPVHVLRAQVTASGAELTRLVPELAERLPELPAPLGGDPEGQRYRLFEAVASLLAGAARVAPVVIVLDDLHWADKPTLLLLRHVARSPEQSPLLVLGTYRETELARTHPLAEMLADLRRDRLFERVALHGLGEGEVGALIGALAGHDAPPEFTRVVYDQTEGNPFFIEEVLRHLAESGAIFQREGRWTTDLAMDQLGIPEGVKEVIGRRLSRLSGACNRVLTLAAVIGREFGLEVLEPLSNLSDDRLLEVVEEAVTARVITEVPPAVGRFGFTHALFRETLYCELTTTRRVRLHRQIGETLEGLYAADPELHLAELAYHFFEAAPGGDVHKAIDYARRAAERATASVAYEEAARFYRLALQALDHQEPAHEGQRGELLLALGDAQARAGDLDDARETFQRAGEVAREVGAPEQLARAALGFGGRFVWGFGAADDCLIALLEESLCALGEGDSALRARVLARLATAFYGRVIFWRGSLERSASRGSLERSASLSQQAVQMARRLGDTAVLAYALDARYFAVWGPDRVEERLAIATEMLRLAEEAGDRERAHQGHHWRMLPLLELGELTAADVEIEAQARLAEDLRQPAQLWYTGVVRAMRALLEGRFEEGERLAQQALAIGQQEFSVRRAMFAAQGFVSRWQQGRLQQLEAAQKGFVEQYPGALFARANLALLYSELGRAAEARREFEHLAANDFADLPRDLFWISIATHISEVCAFLGDTRRAQTLYELLLPYANRNVVNPPSACYGSASRNLGLLAATMARWEEAAEHFENALAMNTRMGARPWVARTQHDYAAMLLARGESGDREKAQVLVTEAVDTARDLGMKNLFEKAEALKLRAQGRAAAETEV